MTTPYDVILKHAETIPDHTALTFGDALWSYADLAEQAGRIAGGLRDIGLGRGDRLAALAGNRPEVALAWTRETPGDSWTKTGRRGGLLTFHELLKEYLDVDDKVVVEMRVVSVTTEHVVDAE